MKKSILLLLLVFSGLSNARAQYDCSFGRYTSKIFQVDTIRDVAYGQNLDLSGSTKVLLMDIYMPKGDTATYRPLVILAHGGTFVSGNKTVVDVMTLANELAKKGYVAVSINYRLGIDVFAPSSLQQKFADAYWRAMQDGRAAVRFFRKDRSTFNNYGIDTSRIFIGGVSAGAVLALGVGYLDQVSEIQAIVDTMRLGGIEGNSGSPGYSSEVLGVINVSGAMPNNTAAIVNNTNIHLLNIHGDRDNTVPYKCDSFYFVGFGVDELCGSYIIDSAARVLNMNSELYTMVNEGHVPWLATGSTFNSAKKYLFDSVENKTGAFLARIICRNLSHESVSSKHEIDFWSTSHGLMLVNSGSNMESMHVSVYDVLGRMRIATELSGSTSKILPLNQAGCYLIVVEGIEQRSVYKVLFKP